MRNFLNEFFVGQKLSVADTWLSLQSDNRVNVKKGNVKGKLSRAVAERLLAGQRNACYVLITCGAPSSRGEMEVEMTYEGDGDLAAYLIDSAQLFLQGPPAIAEYPG